MKQIRFCIISLLVMGFCIGASAQENLKMNLKKHVYTLADDSLMGRPVGTKYMKAAEDYVVNELQSAGLKVVRADVRIEEAGEASVDDMYEIEVIETPLDRLNINKEDLIMPQTIFAYIEGTDPTLKTEWIILNANLQGQGNETMDGHFIINNGANDNLSGVSAVIELAKVFAKEKTNKRSIGFIFSNEGINYNFTYYMERYLTENILNIIKDKRNIKTLFNIEEIGRFEKAIFGIYSSDVITNFKEIVESFDKREDLFIKTDGGGLDMGETIPYVNLISRYYGHFYNKWEDEANTLQYDTMTEAVKYIKELVSVFVDTKEIKLDEKRAYSDRDEWEYGYGERYKPCSYFGISGMVGGNKHYYNEGNMTGKQAMAYSAGVFGKWGITNALGLSLGVNYQRLNAYRHDGKFSSDAISVPLSFIVGYDIREWGIYLSIGGYYDYIFGGKLAKQSLNFSDFNHNEAGLQFGIHIHSDNIILSWYAKYGLTNVMNEKALGNMRSVTNFFQLSYLLP